MSISEIKEYKFLSLIAADKARELGIEAESPVWISPQVQGNMLCNIKECGVIYSPLVYQTGSIVKAQHFHPGADVFNQGFGGIYFYDVSKRIRNGGGESIAQLTAAERIPIDSTDSTFIANEVRVDAIRVACEMRSLKWAFFLSRCKDDQTCSPWLKEGYLVRDSQSKLFPVHSRELAEKLYQVGFAPSGLAIHSLSDGSVVFSAV